MSERALLIRDVERELARRQTRLEQLRAALAEPHVLHRLARLRHDAIAAEVAMSGPDRTAALIELLAEAHDHVELGKRVV